RLHRPAAFPVPALDDPIPPGAPPPCPTGAEGQVPAPALVLAERPHGPARRRVPHPHFATRTGSHDLLAAGSEQGRPDVLADVRDFHLFFAGGDVPDADAA